MWPRSGDLDPSVTHGPHKLQTCPSSMRERKGDRRGAQEGAEDRKRGRTLQKLPKKEARSFQNGRGLGTGISEETARAQTGGWVQGGLESSVEGEEP